MAHAEIFPVSQKDVDAYRRDGVVMLKGVLGDRWLEVLEAGVALNIEQPSPRKRDWVKDEADGNHLFVDAVTVQQNPHLERYMLSSPLGPIAARMMGLPAACAFYVTIFVRSPSTQSRTPWHQDQTYWCAEGRHALSIWTCLDPVPAGTELEFVRGSHLWERPLAKPYFDQEHLGGEIDVGEAEFVAIPDFSGVDRDKYEFLRWPMDPGDVLVFHGMTVHGGSGDLPEDLWRRSVSAQWLGEDARVTTRPGGCSPDLLGEFASNGIVLGDHPACAMCPTVTAAGELFQ
jgi:ectoine hydroxylase-related dioxygenase (phytanoyl-CoA dioxygenase family)